MATLNIRLFGGFRVRSNERVLDCLLKGKMQELFIYLLLHQGRSHTREALADVLWSETTPARAKSYLRHALWRLNSLLESQAGIHPLLIDATGVRIDCSDNILVDVAQFEQAFDLTKGLTGAGLTDRTAHLLQDAVELYQGDLLPDNYLDWCNFERERLQDLYLVVLDKLLTYCEIQGRYENGLVYGARSLRCDPAREQTHQILMRLHYLAGDRTRALRQFDRCVHALTKELGVHPAESTVALYEQIRADRLTALSLEPIQGKSTREAPVTTAPEILELLEHLGSLLSDVQRDLHSVERALNIRRLPA